MSLSGCISHDEIMNNQLVNMLIVVLQLVLVNSCEKQFHKKIRRRNEEEGERQQAVTKSEQAAR